MTLKDQAQAVMLLETIYNIIWGWPLISAILLTGIYFTCKTRILTPSNLKLSLRSIFKKEDCEGDISVFASLCTALSATVGTGNIVGMAVAITLGGPGTVFWLWISSIFSFAIKYAEGFLAIKYRLTGSDGKICGGPMYYIELGLKKKFLAKVFASCGMIVSLISTGTLAQSNSIAIAMNSFNVPRGLTAVVITLCVTTVICGGLKRIAVVSEKLVPIMSMLYIGTALIILLINYAEIPNIFKLIFCEAFSPKSALLGQVVSIGVSRGIYSHESGLGSSAIAAASSKINSPHRQGLVSMSGAIFSVIICTMTSFVLIITANETSIFNPERTLQGLELTSFAFGSGLGIPSLGKYIVGVGIILFAFTTIIGWNYYGEKCTQYILGDKAVMPYKLLYVFFIFVGPFFDIKTIFIISDILIGFMAISNLIGIIGLRNILVKEAIKS